MWRGKVGEGTVRLSERNTVWMTENGHAMGSGKWHWGTVTIQEDVVPQNVSPQIFGLNTHIPSQLSNLCPWSSLELHELSHIHPPSTHPPSSLLSFIDLLSSFHSSCSVCNAKSVLFRNTPLLSAPFSEVPPKNTGNLNNSYIKQAEE